MEEIGIFEAKTHLSEIARRVKETGRPVRITNRGEEMVDIVPVAATPRRRRTKAEAIAELEKIRQTLPKCSMEQILADIREGRRY